ncbi:MAG: alkaline phosphatase family protein [Anaerolineae bacterium]|nr:alkaline phosphatase family protein [Anaerolineae bacterium]
MLNENSLRAVESSRLNEHFRKPLYTSYCFSQIPSLIQHSLTGQVQTGMPADVLTGLPSRYDKVILLFVDAFGWRFFERYHELYPFLKRFLEQGVVSRLTSQFPSTTTAHVTTVHTGLTVDQTGLYEWFYYEPLLDRLIAPLLFSYAGDSEPGTIKLPPGTGLSPVFPYKTVFQQLAAHGVKSYAFQNAAYVNTAFGQTAFAGAQLIGYRTLADGLYKLANAVTAETQPSYFFYYYDGIDYMGHHQGPSSRAFDAEVDIFMTALERILHADLAAGTSNTLLLLAADHGQDDVSPQTTIYVNHVIPELVEHIRTDGGGRLLVPGGSARDLFLYIKPGQVNAAFELLVNHPALAGKAEVRRVSDLIAANCFGPGQPSEAFLARVADLVILPYSGGTVWWYEKGRFEQLLYGHHGGFTPAEMDIPLLAHVY